MRNINRLLKIAKDFENKIDKSVVLEEHDVKPVSYMAHSNLKNIINDASELLSILNDDDEIPAWAEEAISLAKANVNKALSYIRSEKSSK